jgi:glycosyltransferase 2 family protein
MSTRGARILPIFVGIGLLIYLLYQFGAASTWSDLKMIGWRLSAIVALEAVIHSTSARAWWHMYPSESRHGCFSRIWLVQLAGHALNETTPGVPLGGEPIKAMLMKGQFELPVTTATLLSAKLAHALARALFVMLGVVAVCWSLRFEHLPSGALAVGFLLTASGIAAFMVLQMRGLSAPVRRIFPHLRLSRDWVERISHSLERVDQFLHDLYRTRPWDFVASVGLVLAGLCVGVIQVWLMLGWLGLRREWSSSLAIESFSVLVSFVCFIVPGSLGVQEGGKLLIFGALGLPPSAGLSLGVAFRLNSLASLAAGFIAFVSLRRRSFHGKLPNAVLSDGGTPT